MQMTIYAMTIHTMAKITTYRIRNIMATILGLNVRKCNPILLAIWVLCTFFQFTVGWLLLGKLSTPLYWDQDFEATIHPQMIINCTDKKLKLLKFLAMVATQSE